LGGNVFPCDSDFTGTQNHPGFEPGLPIGLVGFSLLVARNSVVVGRAKDQVDREGGIGKIGNGEK
jgi:hypothetical protein